MSNVFDSAQDSFAECYPVFNPPHALKKNKNNPIMLRYIHQFVQTFLREVSKSRPKPHKKSRSTAELVQKKPALKPEISSTNLCNEIQEAEHQKQILELKKTYSLLMKKFVNPKLDLMTSTKALSDINILDLKGKQEFLKSTVNKLFFESTEQPNHSGRPPTHLCERTLVNTLEESSVGWSQQPTSKLAANPMVESPKRSKNIASSLYEYPETQRESSRNKVLQVDKIFENKLKSMTSKDQNNKEMENIKIKTNNMPENLAVGSSNNDTDVLRFNETVAEYNECKKHLQNLDSLILEENRKENHHPLLQMGQYTYPEIEEKSTITYSVNENLTQNDEKENTNLVSPTEVDKSNIANLNTQELEGNIKTFEILNDGHTNQNQSASKQAKIEKKEDTNLKTSDVQQNLDNGVLKKEELINNEKSSVECVQSTCCAVFSENVSADSLVNDSFVSPSINCSATISNDAKNNSHGERENSILVNNSTEEKNNEIKDAKTEKEAKENIEMLLEPTKTFKHNNTPSNTDLNIKTHVKNNKNVIENEKLQNAPKMDAKSVKIENNPQIKTAAKQHSPSGHSKAPKGISLSGTQGKGNATESSSKGSKSVQAKLNMSKSSVFNMKQSNVITNSPFDKSKNITNRLSENKLDSNTSIRKTNNKINENKQSNSRLCNKEPVVSTKSTPCMLSNPLKSSQVEHQSKKINSVANAGKNISETIKETEIFLKQFQNLQKNKPKQRVYRKILNEGKLMKNSIHKVLGNKQKTLVNKVKRLKRTKSDNLTSNITNLRQNPSLVAGTNSKVSMKSEPAITVSRNDRLAAPMNSANDPKKGINLNKINSKIFPPVNGRNSNHEFRPDIGQTNISIIAKPTGGIDQNAAKVKTEFDLTKARKLHSKRDFCKPAQLQMYGGRRSIFTHSHLNLTHSQNMVNPYINEITTTGPDLVTKSLLCVCKLNIHLKNIQLRNIQTGYRGRVKQVPRKTKSKVIKGGGKMKSIKEPVPASLADECNINSSNDFTSKGDCVQVSRKSPDVLKEVENLMVGTPKYEESKCETERKLLNSNFDSAQEGSCNPSYGCSNIENGTKKLICSQSEGYLNEASENCKRGGILDSACTARQTVGKRIKSTELELDLVSKNVQPPQENEVLKESPKWKSKADRLEKWKSEVKFTSLEEHLEAAENRTSDSHENYPCDTQDESIEIDRTHTSLGGEVEEKDNSVDHVFKSDTGKSVNFSNDTTEKIKMQKKNKERDCGKTTCDRLETNSNTEQKIKRLPYDSGKNVMQDTTKNKSEQNKAKNNVTVQMARKVKPTNNVSTTKEKVLLNNKIDVLENKLSILESKVKYLKSKSIEENSGNLLKTNDREDTGDIPKKICRSIIDQTKTGSVKEIKKSNFSRKETPPQKKSHLTGTLLLSVENDTKRLQKTQTSPVNRNYSQTVKNLDKTLQRLETKFKELKNKSIDSNSISNNDLPIKSSENRLSKENKNKSTTLTKQNSILNVSKVVEKSNHCHSTEKNKLGSLNIPNKNSIEDQKSEKFGRDTVVYAKPETFLKHYVPVVCKVLNGSGSVDQIQCSEDKGLNNHVKHHNNRNNDSHPPKTNSGKEGIDIVKNVKTTKEVSENQLNQKTYLKDTVIPAVCNNKEAVSKTMDNIQTLKSNSPRKSFNLEAINKTLNSKETCSRTPAEDSAEEVKGTNKAVKHSKNKHCDSLSSSELTEVINSGKTMKVVSENQLNKNTQPKFTVLTAIRNDKGTGPHTGDNIQILKSYSPRKPLNVDTVGKLLISKERSSRRTHVEDKTEEVKVIDDVKYAKNKKYDLLPPKVSSNREGIEVLSNLKTTKEASEKQLNQKTHPKVTVLSAVGKNKETSQHTMDNIQILKTNSSRKISNFDPTNQLFNGKRTSSRRIQAENKNMQQCNLPLTSDNANITKAKTQNGVNSLKTTSSVHKSPSRRAVITSSGDSSKSEIASSKRSTSDSNIPKLNTGMILTKKIKRKPPTFTLDKKALQKRNQRQHPKKEFYNISVRPKMNKKSNTLHEGLMKSTRLLKSRRSEQVERETPMILDNINTPNLRNLTPEKNLKPPVLPKKLFKALKVIQNHSLNLGNHKEEITLKKQQDPTCTSEPQLLRKEESDLTRKESKTREKSSRTFTSFDDYRSKKTKHEAIHPIEKEKYGIKLLKTNDNLLEKLFDLKHLSQNIVPPKYWVRKYTSGRELAEQLQKKRVNQVNALVGHENVGSKKTTHK